jgi:hypothetical protein
VAFAIAHPIVAQSMIPLPAGKARSNILSTRMVTRSVASSWRERSTAAIEIFAVARSRPGPFVITFECGRPFNRPHSGPP